MWWCRLFLTGWFDHSWVLSCVFLFFILVVIIYYFFSHRTFRSLLGLLARVPGADLSGGGPGSRGIGFSSFYGRVVRSLGVYS